MMASIGETERRRKKQDAYNKEKGIVPKTIIKSVRDVVNLADREEEAAKAEEALLVGVQDGHQGYLGQVQALPQKVDSPRQLEDPPPPPPPQTSSVGAGHRPARLR